MLIFPLIFEFTVAILWYFRIVKFSFCSSNIKSFIDFNFFVGVVVYSRLVEGTWLMLSECPYIRGLSGHSVVAYKGMLYIFGGCDERGTFTNNLFIFNLSMIPSS